jgi:hypothetical protein
MNDYKPFIRGEINIESIPSKLHSRYKYVIKYFRYTFSTSMGWAEHECEDYCEDQKDLLANLQTITEILK